MVARALRRPTCSRRIAVCVVSSNSEIVDFTASLYRLTWRDTGLEEDSGRSVTHGSPSQTQMAHHFLILRIRTDTWGRLSVSWTHRVSAWNVSATESSCLCSWTKSRRAGTSKRLLCITTKCHSAKLRHNCSSSRTEIRSHHIAFPGRESFKRGQP